VIPYQGFLKWKCSVWVAVCAQQNGRGIVWAEAATQHSLRAGTWGSRSEPIWVRTRPRCKYRIRHSSSGVSQPPPGRSHAHFAERKQEPIPGISISRILGMGSHTKLPGMGFKTRPFCFRRNATQSRGNVYESTSSQIAAAHRTAWTRFIAKEEFLNQNNVMVLPRRIRPVSLRYRISVLFTLHAPRTIWAPILQLLSCVNLVFVDMNCLYAHSPLNEMIIMIMNGRY